MIYVPGGPLQPCPHLTEGLQCRIYDDRPNGCQQFDCRTVDWWEDYEGYKFNEEADIMCGGCGRRLTITMERRGWTKEGHYWTDPTGKKSVHNTMVMNNPTAVIAEFPELAPTAAKVITEEVAKAAKDKSIAIARKLGVL
jgi:hypothetical protein